MKKILLVLSIVLMLFISGCTSSTSGKKNGFELGSFNGGSDALSIEFAPASPPEKIRDQSLQPFSVRLVVENLGEYDIPENSAYITLSGFNPADLGMTAAQTTSTLIGLRGFKKQGDSLIPGMKNPVAFDNLAYVNEVVSTMPITIFANICYPYQTKAFAKICINGNTVPSIDTKAQICEIEGDKQFANSGGPVKIENVKQYPAGSSSIRVQFDIVHTPSSTDASVYEPNSINSQCQIGGFSASSSDAYFKRDKIKYTVNTSISGLNCDATGTNTNVVTLTNNRYTVSCIQDTTNQPEYENAMVVTLDYEYLDRISKSVQVEHIQR